MKSPVKFFAACLAIFIFSTCTPGKRAGQLQPDSFRIAFYNVENLFDTEDDPDIFDEEYTPDSKKAWTRERYEIKLARLAQVVEGMGYPALIGLAEVENAAVVQDFCEKTSLAGHGYGFVHFDSPDNRGIDVALLFQKKNFNVLRAYPLPVQFPEEFATDGLLRPTRDLLVVEGVLGKNDTLHLLVVHAPSRSGGKAASEPKRIFVAEHTRSEVDEIFSKKPGAKIVLMGDFNDGPSDPSVATALRAFPLSAAAQPRSLYNCFSTLSADGLGTYNYRGNWDMLDQIILSGELVHRKSGLRFKEAIIFRQDWMMYNDKNYGQSPNRTYGGDRYFGGYSDHLPVMVVLER